MSPFHQVQCAFCDTSVRYRRWSTPYRVSKFVRFNIAVDYLMSSRSCNLEHCVKYHDSRGILAIEASHLHLPSRASFRRALVVACRLFDQRSHHTHHNSCPLLQHSQLPRAGAGTLEMIDPPIANLQ